jgi:hypothetical protein
MPKAKIICTAITKKGYMCPHVQYVTDYKIQSSPLLQAMKAQKKCHVHVDRKVLPPKAKKIKGKRGGEARVTRRLPTKDGFVNYVDSGWTEAEWELIARAMSRRVTAGFPPEPA